MPTLSLSELKAATYAKLEGNQRMYKPAEVTRAINEAIKLTNLFGAWFNTTATVPSTATIANRVIYRVPESIIIPEKVSINGVELNKVGLLQLCRNWPEWMSETTASTGYSVSRWCPYAFNRIIINPADSVGGAYLEITGIGNPPDLEDDSDVISIPKDGVPAVSEYAAHIVQCKLTGTAFTQSIPMYRTYEKYVKSQRKWLTYKQPNVWFDLNKPE